MKLTQRSCVCCSAVLVWIIFSSCDNKGPYWPELHLFFNLFVSETEQLWNSWCFCLSLLSFWSYKKVPSQFIESGLQESLIHMVHYWLELELWILASRNKKVSKVKIYPYLWSLLLEEKRIKNLMLMNGLKKIRWIWT